MVAGAPEGWRQTLDKLEEELTRMQGGDEIHRRKLDALLEAERQGQKSSGVKRSVAHGDFHLERTYDAPVGLVYAALSTEAAKSKWFGGDDGRWTLLERSMDFRVGGRERLRGRWVGGVVTTFDAAYHDIIPNERIIYTYEMHLDDRKISVSLATLQLIASGDGRTTLKVSEQGAFLDGYDDAGSREHGTAELLDRLGESLRSA